MICDASAILAYLRHEDGRAVVAERLSGLVMSVVNLAEAQKRMLSAAAIRPEDVTQGLAAAGVRFVAPDSAVAGAASRYALMPTPKGHRSLSLADGFCVAQAEALSMPLLTADRVWAELDLPAPVELIR